MVVYCEHRTEHVNALHAQNSEFYSGTCANR